MDAPSFYAIIPASVRYDEKLIPNAKLLYGEISAMTGKEGYCWADNSYFAELYDVNVWTISRWISQLEKQGHIKTLLNKIEGNKRKIYIEISSYDLLRKNATPIAEKRKRVLTKNAIPIAEKRTSIYENITINNTMNREKDSLSFLEVNYPERFERLMMQFKSKISDFEKFSQLFEATVQQEKLQYDGDVLEGRFKKFAIHWIDNKNKFQPKVVEMIAKPAYMLKPLS